MALTRLECTGTRSVLLVCACGHRSLHADRDTARTARARHELTVHALTARSSPAAWAVRKARQRARAATP